MGVRKQVHPSRPLWQTRESQPPSPGCTVHPPPEQHLSLWGGAEREVEADMRDSWTFSPRCSGGKPPTRGWPAGGPGLGTQVS